LINPEQAYVIWKSIQKMLYENSYQFCCFTDNNGPKTVQNPSFHKKKLSQAGVDNFFCKLCLTEE
jgi:hypothetical protein